MNDLIKFDFRKREPVVSARTLHQFLEIRTEFRQWFTTMCAYGYSEGIDYTKVIFDHKYKNYQSTKDYYLSISMAKELSLIQKSIKGKIAYQYFRALERTLNTPEMVVAKAIKILKNNLLCEGNE